MVIVDSITRGQAMGFIILVRTVDTNIGVMVTVALQGGGIGDKGPIKILPS
jgi:hypothetical protein